MLLAPLELTAENDLSVFSPQKQRCRPNLIGAPTLCLRCDSMRCLILDPQNEGANQFASEAQERGTDAIWFAHIYMHACITKILSRGNDGICCQFPKSSPPPHCTQKTQNLSHAHQTICNKCLSQTLGKNSLFLYVHAEISYTLNSTVVKVCRNFTWDFGRWNTT